MVYVLRHVIRVRNHVAASVDEKGVRREVPNEHIFCEIYIGTLMLKEWQDSSYGSLCLLILVYNAFD